MTLFRVELRLQGRPVTPLINDLRRLSEGGTYAEVEVTAAHVVVVVSASTLAVVVDSLDGVDVTIHTS